MQLNDLAKLSLFNWYDLLSTFFFLISQRHSKKMNHSKAALFTVCFLNFLKRFSKIYVYIFNIRLILNLCNYFSNL